jgi:hypothetical protein
MTPPQRARTNGAPEPNQQPSEGHTEFLFPSFQAQLTDAFDGLFDETRREQIQVVLKKLDYEAEKAQLIR